MFTLGTIVNCATTKDYASITAHAHEVKPTIEKDHFYCSLICRAITQKQHQYPR